MAYFILEDIWFQQDGGIPNLEMKQFNNWKEEINCGMISFRWCELATKIWDWKTEVLCMRWLMECIEFMTVIVKFRKLIVVICSNSMVSDILLEVTYYIRNKGLLFPILAFSSVKVTQCVNNGWGGTNLNTKEHWTHGNSV